MEDPGPRKPPVRWVLRPEPLAGVGTARAALWASCGISRPAPAAQHLGPTKAQVQRRSCAPKPTAPSLPTRCCCTAELDVDLGGSKRYLITAVLEQSVSPPHAPFSSHLPPFRIPCSPPASENARHQDFQRVEKPGQKGTGWTGTTPLSAPPGEDEVGGQAREGY